MNILYKETMEQMKMSDECSNKIQSELLNCSKESNCKRLNFRKRFIERRVAVAILITIVGLFSVTEMVYGSNGKIMNYIYSFFSGGGITYEKGENGESKSSVILESEPISPVEVTDGKMYFVADGSQRDITDEVSNDMPFIGEWKDIENNTHKFIIGGKANENYYGYYEYIFDVDGTVVGGRGYFGSKVEISKEVEPKWYIKGKELLGID